MYSPQPFDETRVEVLQAMLHAHPLGLLITQDASGATVANPIPFIYEPAGEGSVGTLHGHVARANPVWRDAADQPALVVFQGANGYVSPNWYPSKAETGRVVPTWNYVVVQARGVLRVQEDAARAQASMSRLTQRFEAAQSRPWSLDDAPADYAETLMQAIVVIEIPLQSLVGKFKLSQNRSAADRAGVITGLQADAHNPGQAALVCAMLEHGGQP